jgi:hypothetical protein
MKLLKRATAACVVALFAGCGGGGTPSGDSTGELVSGGVTANITSIQGIAVPPDPGNGGKLTVAGIDANGNGVRDDVERELAKLYGSDSVTFAAAMAFAKATQENLIAINSSGPNVNTALRSEFASYACLVAAIGTDKARDVSREVAMRAFNSGARRAGLKALDDATLGTDLATYAGATCAN